MRVLPFALAFCVVAPAAMAVAKDINPPPIGSVCDNYSRQFIGNNGGKGLRIKVESILNDNMEMHFQVGMEESLKLATMNAKFGGLPAVSEVNFGLEPHFVKKYGYNAGVTVIQGMARDFGSWAIVVPSGTDGVYGVNVLIATGKERDSPCKVAYNTPYYLPDFKVSADLVD